MDKLEKIFQIMSFFDDFRWENSKNYGLINFFKKELDDDSKLLTHWLCYVMDRRMSFESIWDVGGFIVSEIVTDIKEKAKDKNIKNIDLLSMLNPENKIYLDKDSDKEKIRYYFRSKSKANSLIQDKYKNNLIKEGEYEYRVKFKPRYLPTDYISFLSTLVILRDFNFSLSEYISYNFKKHKDEEDIIIRLLYSLHLLTYYDIGNLNSENIKVFKTNIDKAERRKLHVRKIIDNKSEFDKELCKFKKEQIFKQKRAWCSFRDFIKSLEFNEYFQKAMSKYLSNEEIKSLSTQKCLEQFVLPGDVWNNNTIFGKCILSETPYENREDSLNKILNEYYGKNKPKMGYPEQFDITFDFVPRMCEKNNCEICPIGKKETLNELKEKVCINNKNKYCPLALVACNYKNLCVGEKDCKILKII